MRSYRFVAEVTFKLKLNEKRLYPIKSVKYLGIKIDESITWIDHINDTAVNITWIYHINETAVKRKACVRCFLTIFFFITKL